MKDYDDYIARMEKVPKAFSQMMTNMQLGMDEGRMPPKYILEKVLVQAQALAGAEACGQPVCGAAEEVSEVDQRGGPDADLERICWMRSATMCCRRTSGLRSFLIAQYIPEGTQGPGRVGAAGWRCVLRVLMRRSTTLDKTPAEIHQIGLDEVKRDEAEMLAIVQKLGFSDLKTSRRR